MSPRYLDNVDEQEKRSELFALLRGAPESALHVNATLAEIPENLHDGLVEYIMTGRPTGHFLEAVISNDLLQACHRADIRSRVALYAIVYFLFNYGPGACYGSPTHYRTWLERGGLRGKEDDDGSNRLPA